MSWKDSLRPASFRGIPFFIDQSQFTSGRRVTVHEFPDRDKPFPEDMGKVTRSFKVEGHILGDDYFTTKKQLIEAVEKKGEGELVHPYYGTMQVQCGAFSIDEDNREGGIAKISFQFYESGDDNFPKEIDNKAALVEEKADLAKDASKNAFNEKFSIQKLPGFAVETARAGVAKLADTYTEATKTVKTNVEEMANLAYGIRNLKNEAADLLRQPALLSQQIADTFDLLSDAVQVPKEKLKALGYFYGFNDEQLGLNRNTPTRERESDNKEAFDLFIEQIVVANAATISAVAEYESTTEALAAREELLEKINDIIMRTDDDVTFNAFKDLAAQIVRSVPDVDSALPNIEKIILKDSLPSLVVAYEYLNNVDAEEDLVNRNPIIRNPAFVRGGVEIEVLNV